MTYNKKVIILTPWKFFYFVHKNDSSPVECWYGDQPEETQNFFKEILDSCCNIADHKDWPHFKHLHGTREPVWEIGFKSDGRQYRVLGVFDGAKRAVFVGACYHKQRIYTPPNALDDADKRAKLLRQGKGGKRERKN